MRALVTVGSVWRSRDPRDNGLTVTVLRVESSRIQIQRYRKSWVRRNRFRFDYEPVAASGTDGE
jgi:hypothetical protein